MPSRQGTMQDISGDEFLPRLKVKMQNLELSGKSGNVCGGGEIRCSIRYPLNFLHLNRDYSSAFALMEHTDGWSKPASPLTKELAGWIQSTNTP